MPEERIALCDRVQRQPAPLRQTTFMVETIPPPATSPFGAPEVGAAQAMRQALATVVLLQQAVSDDVAIMIPGALPLPVDRTRTNGVGRADVSVRLSTAQTG